MLIALSGCDITKSKPGSTDQLMGNFNGIRNQDEKPSEILGAKNKSLAIVASKTSGTSRRHINEMLDDSQGVDTEFYLTVDYNIRQKRLLDFIVASLKSKFRQVDIFDDIRTAQHGGYDYLSIVEISLQYADFFGKYQNRVDLSVTFINSTNEKVSVVSANGSNAGDSGHWGPPTKESYEFKKLEDKVCKDWVDELNKLVKK